jgi:hypothetical protein
LDHRYVAAKQFAQNTFHAESNGSCENLEF